MLLTLDIGNTTITMALINQQEKIVHIARFETNRNLTADDYALKINLTFEKYLTEKLLGVVISSVVPALEQVMSKLFDTHYQLVPLFVAPGVKSGVHIKIDNPKQLGADLLSGAVGACIKYKHAFIVVDLGTATKLTVVNNKKELLGVIIAPGIVSGLKSLVTHTSGLFETSLEKPKSLIGKDTISSLRSGSIYGTSTMIEGLVKKVQNEIGPAHVILTGGNAEYIKDVLEIPFHYEPHLIIEGLVEIYKKNQK